MNYKIQKKEEFYTENWQGGNTTELALYPPHSQMQNKDFVWRLSKLSIEKDGAALTNLPNYDRLLMVLSGEAVLSFDGQRTSRLQEKGVECFDGGALAESFGKADCYQLLLQKGYQGSLDVIKLSPERAPVESISGELNGQISQGFYCCQGYAVVAVGGETCMVREGDQLVVDYSADELVSLGVMGEGMVVHAQMTYGETVPEEEEIPRAKASFRDLISAAAISMTNFRGSRFIFRYLNHIWYDEALKRGIRAIERFYLPMMLWIVGICGVAFWGVERFSPEIVFLIIGLWSLAVYLILSPLLYFIALPKPIKSHIKQLDSLTEREKSILENELTDNPRADKILKRYKISGRNVYLPDKPKKKK